MFVKMMQATTITFALYALLGLSVLQTNAAGQTVEPAEVIVALKEALKTSPQRPTPDQ
ncbi:MAG: hypothetical protein AAF810_12895 [Cyanobacteria bacterium P01_D01_bin.36]